MSDGTVLRCWDCDHVIGDKESYWGYHYLGGTAVAVYCLECLIRIKPIIANDAPLLPPKGWGPSPMKRAPSSPAGEAQPPKA